MAFCNQTPLLRCVNRKEFSEALRGDEAANRPRRLRQTALGSRYTSTFPSGAVWLSCVLDTSWLAAGSQFATRRSPWA